jgi:D-alanine-D-alanine ligase
VKASNPVKNVTKKTNKKLISALGPVEDLESYVKADWWKHIFNANYLRTDNDVVGDDAVTNYEVDLFEKFLDLPKNANILDLCCGQGRHVIEFCSRGYKNIFGLDRSHYLITRARAIAKKNNLDISFKEGDARKLPYLTNHFDAVMILGNSFGYFETQKDDQLVLAEIFRILKPKGKLLIDITDGDYTRENFEPRSWEWIDKNYFVCRERSISSDNERLISREVITHVNKGVVADQFYAERLYSPQQLQELLTENEFINVGLKETMNTQSQRNQDLGMMARRNIITAKVSKQEVLVANAHPRVLRVAVLLGDPKKSDVIKPGGTFDDDDINTINSLKRALKSLSHYEFEFFSDHDSFVKLANKWKNEFDFVFNLCDEGFGNRAEFELHIPALLEMFHIPYTGGNPQCLAYCYDKSLIRGLANEMDIPVAEGHLIKPDETTFIDITIPFPVIIKPNSGDSSFGITKENVCSNIIELESAILSIRQKFGYENPVLIEQYLTGKDISVGIIGNPSSSFHFLPIIEEDYSVLPPDLPKICGYEAKWDPLSPYWKIVSIDANLPEPTVQFLHASCMKLFERLECRDYARFDWRLDNNGTPRLLEVNPNPGWCWDGHLAKMAKLEGISYAGMLHKILQSTESRLQLSLEQVKEKRAVNV